VSEMGGAGWDRPVLAAAMKASARLCPPLYAVERARGRRRVKAVEADDLDPGKNGRPSDATSPLFRPASRSSRASVNPGHHDRAPKDKRDSIVAISAPRRRRAGGLFRSPQVGLLR